MSGAYERRIAELTGEVAALADEVRALQAEKEARATWVPLGHFYSPMPDIAEIRRRHDQIFDLDVLDVPGVSLRLDAQWALFEALAPCADGVTFATDAAQAAANGDRYRVENPSFGFADALALTMMLRHHRPKRLVELGCGFSSACTLDARDRYLGGDLALTFIDPYLDQLDTLLRDDDVDVVTRIEAGSQDVDLAVFADLRAGDMLFVDSTHVSRTGSDVNRVVFEILPSLAPGVLVHVHDVFPGFEYPQPWVYEGRGWNELYVLRAFLQYNDTFRVHWWPHLLHAVADDERREAFGVLEHLNGGSLWLEKTASSL